MMPRARHMFGSQSYALKGGARVLRLNVKVTWLFRSMFGFLFLGRTVSVGWNRRFG